MVESIYLDHAATTPPRREVVERMAELAWRYPANPESVHTPGQAARSELERSRDTFARAFGVPPQGVIFTACGSEANGLAILGTALARELRGHLVSLTIEHHSVLHHLELARRLGMEVTLVEVGPSGVAETERVLAAVREDTVLVSVMAVNNELGTIQPIGEIYAALRERGVTFHCDAVQAVAHPGFDLRDFPADLITIACHKFYGPKGVGVLIRKGEVPLMGVVRGGAHEFDLRAGTHNLPAIGGGAMALEMLLAERRDYAQRIREMRDRFEEMVLAAEVGAVVNGDPQRRAEGISNLSFPGLSSETLVLRLDLEGVACSAGSACTSGSLEVSHVLRAIGVGDERARSAVRFSFGLTNTMEDVEWAAERVVRVVRTLRQGIRVG